MENINMTQEYSDLSNLKITSCGYIKDSIPRFPSSHPLYVLWSGMKQRCYNKRSAAYKNYGGRGIKVHDAWKKNFTQFVLDMGERPSLRHSLDRIDVNGNYEPSNCRWATGREQAYNKRYISDSERKSLDIVKKEWGVSEARMRELMTKVSSRFLEDSGRA